MGLQSKVATTLLGEYKKKFSSLVNAQSLHSLWDLADCKSRHCNESGEFVVGGGDGWAKTGTNGLPAPQPQCTAQPQPPAAEPQNTGPTEALTQPELEEIMHQLSDEVSPWRHGGFTFVRRLQAAPRNQGSVDLMRGPTSLNSKLVAVKRMPTAWVRKSFKEFETEDPSSLERPWYDMGIVSKLNAVNFPYACKLEGVFGDHDSTWVVTSLATDGDLFSWCERACPPGSHREREIRPIVGQIFAAVRWLHDIGIAHGDLSLENILLTKGGGGQLRVKVIDFGMATLSRRGVKARGKAAYQAPEMNDVAVPEYDTFLSDVFALGVVLYSMAAQNYPWAETKPNMDHVFEYVRTKGLRKFLSTRKDRVGCDETLIKVFSPGLVSLLEGLLKIDPEERLTVGEACFAAERNSVWGEEWMKGWVGPIHL